MPRYDIASDTSALTPKRIARFWLPLQATWLMMAAEGPFLAGVIARLPVPKENLAAFAVASALAWIVESPIIMMLSASNALVRDAIAYRKLRRFSNALNAAVTAVMIILIIPPVFDLVARRIMGLTPEVAGLAGRSMIFLVLWPGAIGFRRFYQGILIRDGRPQAVTWGTVVRLTTMAATGIFLAIGLGLPGASVGAGALGAGVLAEGAASWIMARPTVRRLLRMPDDECGFGRALTQAQVVRFYAPLALTSFLSFFVNPLTTFFLARGRFPIASLAVLPVIVGLAFIFRTGGHRPSGGRHRPRRGRGRRREAQSLAPLHAGARRGLSGRPGHRCFHANRDRLVRLGFGPRSRPGRVRRSAGRPPRPPSLSRIRAVFRAGHPGQVAPDDADQHSRRRPARRDGRRVRGHGYVHEDRRGRCGRPGADHGLRLRPRRSPPLATGSLQPAQTNGALPARRRQIIREPMSLDKLRLEVGLEPEGS